MTVGERQGVEKAAARQEIRGTPSTWGCWRRGPCGSLAERAVLPAKAAPAQSLPERAWTRSLEGQTRLRPWSWADSCSVARPAVPELGTIDARHTRLSGGDGRPSLTRVACDPFDAVEPGGPPRNLAYAEAETRQ